MRAQVRTQKVREVKLIKIHNATPMRGIGTWPRRNRVQIVDSDCWLGTEDRLVCNFRSGRAYD